MLNSRRAAGVFVGCVLLVSCGGGSDSSSEPTTPVVTKVLTSITVTVGSPTIQVGQTTTATASGLDQNGASISTGTVTWSSASTSIATVNPGTGVVTAVGLGQTQITATAGAKQGSVSIVVIAAAVTGKLRIAFARGAKCNRDDASGCDLFFTDVDMATKAVITPATGIAETAGVTEFFPGLSSTGRFVVYNRITEDSKGVQLTNDIWAADLTKKGSAALLIANARFPEISADDKKIYFSRPDKPRGELYVAALTINETAGTISVGTITNLTSTITTFTKAEDPYPFGTGGQVAFHYQVSDATPSVVAVLDPTTNSVTPIVESAGHPSVNSVGTIASSPLSGGISMATAKTGGWNTATTLSLPSTASVLATADTAFNTRSIVRWSYVQWVDDGHLIASVMGGAVASSVTTFTMSRLYLVTTNGGTYELLTTLLGGVYADYCTAAVRVLK